MQLLWLNGGGAMPGVLYSVEDRGGRRTPEASHYSEARGRKLSLVGNRSLLVSRTRARALQPQYMQGLGLVCEASHF